MKRLTFLTTLFTLLLITIPTEHTAAKALADNDYVLYFYDKDGSQFESTSARKVFSKSGNITVSASFQLPQGHYLVPDKGTNTIAVRLEITDSSGESVELFCITNINPNGRFTVKYHLNGAGDFFPNGWGMYWKLSN